MIILETNKAIIMSYKSRIIGQYLFYSPFRGMGNTNGMINKEGKINFMEIDRAVAEGITSIYDLHSYWSLNYD